MECTDVELRPERLLCALAELADLELTDLVRQRPAGPDDVPIGLCLDLRLVDCGVVAEILHDLLARPLLRMKSGVDDKANRAEHFVIEAAIAAVWILIEAHFPAE